MSLRYTVGVMTARQSPPLVPELRVPAKDAARLLGVSVRTLDRYQAAGRIAPLAVPENPRMFRVADLAELCQPKGGAA